jgi:hypothetical protein
VTDLNGKYAPLPGKIPGVVLNLGGHEFVLAPLGLLLMRSCQDKSRALSAKKEPAATPEEWNDWAVDIILASLVRNYTDMTREHLEPLLDSYNTDLATSAVLSQTGLKRATPGELKPAE